MRSIPAHDELQGIYIQSIGVNMTIDLERRLVGLIRLAMLVIAVDVEMTGNRCVHRLGPSSPIPLTRTKSSLMSSVSETEYRIKARRLSRQLCQFRFSRFDWQIPKILAVEPE
jgi:hypothetical protein